MPAHNCDLNSMPLDRSSSGHDTGPHLAWAILLTALAGGMGWGIRGQYGHETGAMIAGVLAGFTLILLFLPWATSLCAARAVAMFAVGIGIGGSMTYGQTIGLTQDADLIGNWSALRWGLLGLFIKGGIWIGFGGALLGMGLSGKRYSPWEMALLFLSLLVVFVAGVWLINRPFDPAHQVLPRIYFSADWYWKPGATLKPRPECWGGLLLALAGLIAYLQWVRHDRLARNMAFVGFLAGGIGFSGGQSVQAFHAWHPAFFATGLLARLDPSINWWNMMEITFGATWGGVVAAGLWANRRLIAGDPQHEQVVLHRVWEWSLLALYVALLVAAEFSNFAPFELFLEFGLLICVLPLIGILGGRYWPYLFVLPIVALPIAGKTLLELSYKHAEFPPLWGWVVLFGIPVALAVVAAISLALVGKSGQSSRNFARCGLLTCTWLYFALNLSFFRFPWPWLEWTGRTPSGIIFAICTVILTAAAVAADGDRPHPAAGGVGGDGDCSTSGNEAE